MNASTSFRTGARKRSGDANAPMILRCPTRAIGRHFDVTTGRAQTRGKTGCIARIDCSVVGARHQQRRRLAAGHVGNRLRRRGVGAPENHLQGFVLERKKVIWSGDADQTCNISTRRKADRSEPAAIDRKHRRDIGAGRMPHDEQACCGSPPKRAALSFAHRTASAPSSINCG